MFDRSFWKDALIFIVAGVVIILITKIIVEG